MDHRILQIVVDDIDAACSCARQNKSRERVCERRRARRKHAVHRIEKKLRRDKENVAGANFNRQSATVEPALECLNFKRDAIVVNAITP